VRGLNRGHRFWRDESRAYELLYVGVSWISIGFVLFMDLCAQIPKYTHCFPQLSLKDESMSKCYRKRATMIVSLDWLRDIFLRVLTRQGLPNHVGKYVTLAGHVT
jgi:hypothetical protein